MAPGRRRAEHGDRAGGERNETEASAHQRRLAGAVGAKHADEFAVFNREIGGGQNCPAAELDRDLIETKRAHCVALLERA